MADVVHAFMESPQWKRGALFIVYDEWGGFFDHVRAADACRTIRASDDLGTGLRADGHPHPRRRGLARTRGAGTSTTTIYGFESILKMIEYRFGLRR